jgi:hypothetical protein
MKVQILCRYVFFSCLFVISSCLKDDFNKLSDSTWNPDFSFPLVNSDLDVNDILIQDNSPTQIGINSDDIVEIIYSSNNYSKHAEDLLNLPNQSYPFLFSLSTTNTNTFNANPAIGASVIETVSTQCTYNLDNQLGLASRLDSTWLKAGKLRIDFNSQVPQNSVITVSIPSLLVNNQPFTEIVLLNNNGLGNTSAFLERNLNNALLINDANESFAVNYSIQVIRNNGASIPATGQFTSTIQLQNLEFSRISGYFNNLSMPVPNDDTLFVRIFKNIINAAELSFQNPRGILTFRNSTGLPAQGSVLSFNGFRIGSSIPLVNLSSIPNPVSIFPMGNFSGPPAQTSFELNGSNGSNIVNTLNAFPKYMLTDAAISLNQGSTPATYNYLLDTSRVGITSEIRLPLDGITVNLSLIDTVPFEISTISKDVERALLRLNVTNGFPTNGLLQLYFAKENFNFLGQSTGLTVIDSLYENGTEAVLESGVANSSGLVVTPVQTITDAIITAAKWKKLSDASTDKIIVKAKLTTYDLGQLIVKVTEQNRLNVRIGAQIKIRKTF